jgi:endogenous inhibitor of DNA gyrase (YacG/DUF329 family)
MQQCPWCGKNIHYIDQTPDGTYCSRKCASEDPNREAVLEVARSVRLKEMKERSPEAKMEKLLREARALEEKASKLKENGEIFLSKGEQGKANRTRGKAVRIYMKKANPIHSQIACRFFMEHDRWPTQEEVDERVKAIPPMKPLEKVGLLVFILFAWMFWDWLLL